MQNVEYDNFIGIYDNFFSEQFCKNLINTFKWCSDNNRVFYRNNEESLRSDSAIYLTEQSTKEIAFSIDYLGDSLKEFNNTFWNFCYKDYSKKYSTLSSYGNRTIFEYKIQKTEPTKGYHSWHCEDTSRIASNRIGVYLLYLNDIEDGGETEFLYLSKRIKPKMGKLLIFPPNYPWTHRGNPPLSGSKYIMTGWIEFN